MKTHLLFSPVYRFVVQFSTDPSLVMPVFVVVVKRGGGGLG